MFSVFSTRSSEQQEIMCVYIQNLNCLSMEDSAILIVEDKLFQRVIKRMTKKHISNGRWLFDFSADFVDKFLVCVDTTFLLNFPSSLYSYYSHPFISPIPKTQFFTFQFSNSRNEPFFFGHMMQLQRNAYVVISVLWV